MNIHRQRVRIGAKDSSAQVKWVQGKTIDELNDNIAKTYVEFGLLDGLLSETERRQLAVRLLRSIGEDVSSVAIQDTPIGIRSKMCFQRYTEAWFKTYKEGKLKPTTLSGYRSNLRRHIYPALGHLHFTEVTTDVLQQFLSDRQELAHNTLHTMLVLISEILDSAVEDGLIAKNPALSKKLFIPSDRKKQRKALTLDELQDIIRQLRSLKDVRQKCLLALMLFTGMRRGEVLALRWENVDFAQETITVSQALSYSSNQPILSTTKTANGLRTIPMNSLLKELLLPYRSAGYIIGGEKPITHMVFKRLYKELSKTVNLHGATPHVFRHSYLSLLNQAGVDPKTIQAIGGHGNFMLTYNIYVHSSNQQMKTAGERVNDLLTENLQDNPSNPAGFQTPAPLSSVHR